MASDSFRLLPVSRGKVCPECDSPDICHCYDGVVRRVCGKDCKNIPKSLERKCQMPACVNSTRFRCDVCEGMKRYRSCEACGNPACLDCSEPSVDLPDVFPWTVPNANLKALKAAVQSADSMPFYTCALCETVTCEKCCIHASMDKKYPMEVCARCHQTFCDECVKHHPFPLAKCGSCRRVFCEDCMLHSVVICFKSNCSCDSPCICDITCIDCRGDHCRTCTRALSRHEAATVRLRRSAWQRTRLRAGYGDDIIAGGFVVGYGKKPYKAIDQQYPSSGVDQDEYDTLLRTVMNRGGMRVKATKAGSDGGSSNGTKSPQPTSQSTASKTIRNTSGGSDKGETGSKSLTANERLSRRTEIGLRHMRNRATEMQQKKQVETAPKVNKSLNQAKKSTSSKAALASAGNTSAKAPSKPSQPAQVVASSKSSQPAQTVAPNKSSQPAQAVAPSKSPQPAQAVAPSKSSLPAQAVAPSKSSQPAQAVAPSKSSQPVQAAAPNPRAPQSGPSGTLLGSNTKSSMAATTNTTARHAPGAERERPPHLRLRTAQNPRGETLAELQQRARAEAEMRALQAAAELLADEAQETQHTSTGGAKAAGGKKKKKKKGKKKTTSAASKTGRDVPEDDDDDDDGDEVIPDPSAFLKAALQQPAKRAASQAAEVQGSARKHERGNTSSAATSVSSTTRSSVERSGSKDGSKSRSKDGTKDWTKDEITVTNNKTPSAPPVVDTNTSTETTGNLPKVRTSEKDRERIITQLDNAVKFATIDHIGTLRDAVDVANNVEDVNTHSAQKVLKRLLRGKELHDELTSAIGGGDIATIETVLAKAKEMPARIVKLVDSLMQTAESLVNVKAMERAVAKETASAMPSEKDGTIGASKGSSKVPAIGKHDRTNFDKQTTAASNQPFPKAPAHKHNANLLHHQPKHKQSQPPTEWQPQQQPPQPPPLLAATSKPTERASRKQERRRGYAEDRPPNARLEAIVRGYTQAAAQTAVHPKPGGITVAPGPAPSGPVSTPMGHAHRAPSVPSHPQQPLLSTTVGQPVIPPMHGAVPGLARTVEPASGVPTSTAVSHDVFMASTSGQGGSGGHPLQGSAGHGTAVETSFGSSGVPPSLSHPRGGPDISFHPAQINDPPTHHAAGSSSRNVGNVREEGIGGWSTPPREHLRAPPPGVAAKPLPSQLPSVLSAAPRTVPASTQSLHRASAFGPAGMETDLFGRGGLSGLLDESMGAPRGQPLSGGDGDRRMPPAQHTGAEAVGSARAIGTGGRIGSGRISSGSGADAFGSNVRSTSGSHIGGVRIGSGTGTDAFGTDVRSTSGSHVGGVRIGSGTGTDAFGTDVRSTSGSHIGGVRIGSGTGTDAFGTDVRSTSGSHIGGVRIGSGTGTDAFGTDVRSTSGSHVGGVRIGSGTGTDAFGADVRGNNSSRMGGGGVGRDAFDTGIGVGSTGGGGLAEPLFGGALHTIQSPHRTQRPSSPPHMRRGSGSGGDGVLGHQASGGVIGRAPGLPVSSTSSSLHRSAVPIGGAVGTAFAESNTSGSLFAEGGATGPASSSGRGAWPSALGAPLDVPAKPTQDYALGRTTNSGVPGRPPTHTLYHGGLGGLDTNITAPMGSAALGGLSSASSAPPMASLWDPPTRSDRTSTAAPDVTRVPDLKAPPGSLWSVEDDVSHLWDDAAGGLANSEFSAPPALDTTDVFGLSELHRHGGGSGVVGGARGSGPSTPSRHHDGVPVSLASSSSTTGTTLFSLFAPLAPGSKHNMW